MPIICYLTDCARSHNNVNELRTRLTRRGAAGGSLLIKHCAEYSFRCVQCMIIIIQWTYECANAACEFFIRHIDSSVVLYTITKLHCKYKIIRKNLFIKPTKPWAHLYTNNVIRESVFHIYYLNLFLAQSSSATVIHVIMVLWDQRIFNKIL